MKTEHTEVLGRQTAKPRKIKAQSSHRHVRTACTIVHHYNGIQHCNAEAVLFIFLFLQTNITSWTWPTGGKGA